jgi:hypothetical protein
MRRIGLVLGLAAAAIVAGLAIALRAGAGDPPPHVAGVFSGGSVVEPAYTIGAPVAASAPTGMWAPLRGPGVVRAEPRRGAPIVGRLDARTHDGTTMIVQVLGRAPAGRGWLHVRYPSVSNEASGWIRRPLAGPVETVDTRLVIDRASFALSLYRSGRIVFRSRIGVGAPGTPTPAGAFYVLDRLSRFRDPAYGPIAFGTSGRSPELTDWPGGGVVGLHGTDRPGLIPGDVSHGCIRLRNEDILRLAPLLPIGTPVEIR